MSLVHYKNHSRELAAQLARDISGIFISGGLASIKPWLILATIYNSVNCGRHIFAFHKFRKALKLEGIRIRWRDILKGCFEGALVKIVTTVLTFGHDDFVDVIKKIGRPMGLSRSHAINAIGLDERRDCKAVIHAMSQAAGTPASGTLDRMHIDKKQQDLGYNASGQVVAKESVRGRRLSAGRGNRRPTSSREAIRCGPQPHVAPLAQLCMAMMSKRVGWL